MLKNTYNTRTINKVCKKISNKVIRSDNLDKISKEEIDCLYKEGIREIIDLRKHKNSNSSIVYDSRFKYHFIPFDLKEWGFDIDLLSDEEISTMLLHEYLDYSEQKETIKRIVNIILNCEQKVIIMCRHGKDRTGVVIALLLMLAGCEKKDIIEDYSLSSTYLVNIDVTNKYSRLKSKPEIMERFIDEILSRYVTIENYFMSLGMKEKDVNNLIEYLLT